MCAQCWLASDRSLSLLPFDASNVLLPGDTLELTLTRSEHLSCVEAACNQHFGMIGQLLRLTDTDDEHSAVTQRWYSATPGAPAIASWAPLLQIMEIREPGDAGSPEVTDGACWVHVKCVGRVDLIAFSQEIDLCAIASPKIDHTLLETECLRELDELHRTACTAHFTCRSLVAEMKQLSKTIGGGYGEDGRGDGTGVRAGADLPPSAESVADIAQWLDTDPALEFAAREEVLRQRGLDEAPSTSLRALHEIWGSHSEEAAKRQLQSFAWSPWLSPQERLRASECTCTVWRCNLVAQSLQNCVQRAAAELALRRALSG